MPWWQRISAAVWRLLPDRCEQPGCSRKGTRGNENVVDGRRTCDYCLSRMMQGRRR